MPARSCQAAAVVGPGCCGCGGEPGRYCVRGTGGSFARTSRPGGWEGRPGHRGDGAGLPSEGVPDSQGHRRRPGESHQPRRRRQRGGGAAEASGVPDLPGRSYFAYASFSDPDGNGWLLQEITTRLPGRVDAETAFASVADLASALRRAAAAHGEHEKREGGEYDVNWPDWYAEYMVAEQAGTELPA